MRETVYLNGEYLRASTARLHLSDLAILRGYGVFDYFRYAGDAPRFLTDHLVRLRGSAAALNLHVPLSDSELTAVIHELINRNGGGDGGIRIVVTGGYATDGYTPQVPNLMLLPYMHHAPDANLYTQGCHCMLHAFERQLPRAKTIDYIEGIRIQPMLQQRGAQYPLYVDRAGAVRESDRSNFMIVRDGVLITPREDILLGITRKQLLQLARELGIRVAERTVMVDEVLNADEALICSTVKGAMPIAQVDTHTIGGGAAGAMTKLLMQSWREYA